MMNKKVLPIVAVAGVVIVVGVIAAVVASGGKKADSASTAKSSSKAVSYKAIKACDLLTLPEAKQLIGDSATAGDNNSAQSSSDVSVDLCTYTVTGASLSDSKGTSVLVRSPLSKDGLESNESAFTTQRPVGAQDVSGYGQKAYFNPQYGQLNVLKDGVWYIISNGSAFHPDQSTVADTKLAADKVFN